MMRSRRNRPGPALRLVLPLIALGLLAAPARADLAGARAELARGEYQKAFAAFLDLAKAGNVEAEAAVAEMYFLGRGTTPDPDAALAWFRSAAEAGNLGSQINLALLYVQRSEHDKAIPWFRKAAERGDPEAMASLGVLYLQGLGVPADVAAGIGWYTKAAETGDPDMQMQLGLILLDGMGGEPRPQAGLSWLRRSAEQNYLEAQMRLADLYRGGGAIPRDLVEAYRWLHQASMQGEERAGAMLGEIAGEMTPEAIAEAKRRAAAWRPGSE